MKLPKNVLIALRLAKRLDNTQNITLGLFCRHYARKCLIDASKMEYNELINVLEAKIRSVVGKLQDEDKSILFVDYSDELENYTDNQLLSCLERIKSNSIEVEDLNISEEIIVAYDIIMRFDLSKKDTEELNKKNKAAYGLKQQLIGNDLDKDENNDVFDAKISEKPITNYDPIQDLSDDDLQIDMGCKSQPISNKIDEIDSKNNSNNVPHLNELEIKYNTQNEEKYNVNQSAVELSMNDIIKEENSSSKYNVVNKNPDECIGTTILNENLDEKSLIDHKNDINGINANIKSFEDPNKSDISTNVNNIDQKIQVDDTEVKSSNKSKKTHHKSDEEVKYTLTNSPKAMSFRNMRQIIAKSPAKISSSKNKNNPKSSSNGFTSNEVIEFIMEISEKSIKRPELVIKPHHAKCGKLFNCLSDSFQVLIEHKVELFHDAVLGLVKFSHGLLVKDIINNAEDHDGLLIQSLFSHIYNFLDRRLNNLTNPRDKKLVQIMRSSQFECQENIERYIVNTVLSFTQKSYVITLSWALMCLKFIVDSL